MMILVTRMKASFVNPDKILIEKNKEGKELLFVQQGECMFTLEENNMFKPMVKKDEKKGICGYGQDKDDDESKSK